MDSPTAAEISIHSPRMGRDMTHDQKLAALVKFQSTLPAWGETTDKSAEEGNRNISIHSPRMGRDELLGVDTEQEAISIHSPRMGRDLSLTIDDFASPAFQSTLPAWGETKDEKGVGRMGHISIHSPRMGRDQEQLEKEGVKTIIFQSTLPAWGETLNQRWFTAIGNISIHSPRMGRD